jgi:hypothetical protein
LRYKVNCRYLQDKHVVDELGRIWCFQPPTFGFFGKLRHIIWWYKFYCKERVKEQRASEAKARLQLAHSHKRLQEDPDDVAAQEDLAIARATLEELEAGKLAG